MPPAIEAPPGVVAVLVAAATICGPVRAASIAADLTTLVVALSVSAFFHLLEEGSRLSLAGARGRFEGARDDGVCEPALAGRTTADSRWPVPAAVTDAVNRQGGMATAATQAASRPHVQRQLASREVQ